MNEIVPFYGKIDKYNVRIAKPETDIIALGDLEARKFCENTNLEYDIKYALYYSKALFGAAKNYNSKMLIANEFVSNNSGEPLPVGQLHGFISYQNQKQPQFLLNGVYVLPNHRNRGVGKKLIQTLEQTLAKQDEVFKIVSQLDYDSDEFLIKCGFWTENNGSETVKISDWSIK